MKKLQAVLVIAALLGAIINQAALAEAVKEAAPETQVEESKKTNVKEIIDSIKSYSADKKDEAIAKAKEALDNFDERMQKLEKKIEEKNQQWGEAVANKNKRKIEEAKEKRKEVGINYGKLKDASKESWEKTKDAFINAYQQLENKFEKTKKETSDSKGN